MENDESLGPHETPPSGKEESLEEQARHVLHGVTAQMSSDLQIAIDLANVPASKK